MTKRINIKQILIALVIFEMLFLYSINAKAHCDTLDGPVVESARNALATGDVTPVLKWVPIDDEQLIRTAFQNMMEVRKIGGQAQITIGKKTSTVRAGEMLIMPANISHALHAEQKFKMLLVMIRGD